MEDDSKLLLDTHVFIWLMNGTAGKISKPRQKLISKKARLSMVYVSAISIWEIGMREAKSRIKFQISCNEWIKRALGTPGISLLELSPEVAVESSRLPGNFHGDPADRIIVASARVHGMHIMTADRRILDYASDGNVAAVACE